MSRNSETCLRKTSFRRNRFFFSSSTAACSDAKSRRAAAKALEPAGAVDEAADVAAATEAAAPACGVARRELSDSWLVSMGDTPPARDSDHPAGAKVDDDEEEDEEDDADDDDELGVRDCSADSCATSRAFSAESAVT